MGTGAVCRRLLAEEGDFGGVRTTATFLGSLFGGVGKDGVRERLPGVPGDPGLLYPLLSPDLVGSPTV